MTFISRSSLLQGFSVIVLFVGLTGREMYGAFGEGVKSAPDYSWVGAVGEGTGILLRTFGLPALAQGIMLKFFMKDAPQDFTAAARKRLAATGCWGGASLSVKMVPGLRNVAALRPFGTPWTPYVLIDPDMWASFNENQQHMILGHEFGHLYNLDNVVQAATLSLLPLVLWGVGRWSCARATKELAPVADKMWARSIYRRRMEAGEALAYSYRKQIPGYVLLKRLKRNALVDWTMHKAAVVIGLRNASSWGDVCTLFFGRVVGGICLGGRLFGILPPGWESLSRLMEARADNFALAHARSAEDIIGFRKFFQDIDIQGTQYILNRYVEGFIRNMKRQMDPIHPLPEERAERCREALLRFKPTLPAALPVAK